MRERGGKGSGVWELTYTVRSGSGSERRRGYATFRGTETQAGKRLQALIADAQRGEYVKPVRQTLDAYLHEWLDDLTLATSTVRGYRQKVREYVVPAIGNVPLSDLKPADVLAVHRYMRKRGLSESTILHAHRVLNTALNHAVKVLQLIRLNPCQNVPTPKPAPTERMAFDVEDYQRFISMAEEHWGYDVFAVAFATGARRSEVLGLRWRDVDVKRKAITICGALHRVDGKGLVRATYTKSQKSHRTLDVDDDTIAMLEARRLNAADGSVRIPAWKDDDLVFTRPDGSPFDPDSVSKAFTLVRKAAGIPEGRLHDARHTVATWLLADGEDPQQVAAFMGHSNTGTTFRFYSHAIPGRGKATAARLKRLRDGLEG